MMFSCYGWLTHDIDLSCVHCMLSIKVRSQCYILITHAQHIINIFIDLTWHIQTFGRCTSVSTSLIYHGLKFINQNNVVHQLRYYFNSAPVSNKQSKSTTNNLSRTWWGMRSHQSSWQLMIRWMLEWRFCADSSQCSNVVLEPTSCADTTMCTNSDIISLLIHRCSLAPT